MLLTNQRPSLALLTNESQPHLSPGQQRGVRHVKLVSSVSQSLPAGRGLLHPLGGQAGVIPAAKPEETKYNQRLAIRGQSEANIQIKLQVSTNQRPVFN